MLGLMLPTVVLFMVGFALMNIVFGIGGAVGGAIAGGVGGFLAQLMFGPMVYGGPVRKLFVEYWSKKAG